jgi:hypothetical protein
LLNDHPGKKEFLIVTILRETRLVAAYFPVRREAASLGSNLEKESNHYVFDLP